MLFPSEPLRTGLWSPWANGPCPQGGAGPITDASSALACHCSLLTPEPGPFTRVGDVPQCPLNPEYLAGIYECGHGGLGQNRSLWMMVSVSCVQHPAPSPLSSLTSSGASWKAPSSQESFTPAPSHMDLLQPNSPTSIPKIRQCLKTENLQLLQGSASSKAPQDAVMAWCAPSRASGEMDAVRVPGGQHPSVCPEGPVHCGLSHMAAFREQLVLHCRADPRQEQESAWCDLPVLFIYKILGCYCLAPWLTAPQRLL